MTQPQISDSADKRLTKLAGILFDLDGTLYVSEQLLTGTQPLLADLTARSMPHLFLTNNSSKSAKNYVDKLAGFGIAVTRDQVMTSGQATITHLRHQTPHRSAYVVGTPALREEFVEAGIVLDAQNPDCVVLGYDTSVDYEKLCDATRLLFAGKPYYATHPDKTCITSTGLLPDIAALIAGLEAVTGRFPIILGKPELAMVDAAARRLGVAPQQLAMVGDQLDTDMTMAKRHGLLAVLVLTGETDRGALAKSDVQPDIVLEHAGQLSELLPKV
ncbi:MAG: HAD-IIA family hydrolase [Deltaproteobacteria bacterium]|nr:HAD-IIA family hydrolase [Deltaproteobacteria bacterium]